MWLSPRQDHRVGSRNEVTAIGSAIPVLYGGKKVAAKKPVTRKITPKMDDRMDRKAGIKEGSKRDNALDRKRGVPIERVKSKKGY